MLLSVANIIRYLLIICIFVGGNSNTFSLSLPNWHLNDIPQTKSENLTYQLAYSGFITAFVWKNLANVAIQAKPNQSDFNNSSHCTLSMKVSTEQYVLAEALRATRMQWRSTLNSDDSKLYYSEKIDLDSRVEHEVTWINRGASKIEYYKTPEKEDTYINEFEEDYDDFEEPPDKESLIVKNIPLLSHRPDKLQDTTQLKLINSVSLPEIETLLDPLSLLYVARWNNYSEHSVYLYNVAYKDEVRQYRLQYRGKETLILYDKPVATLKVESKRWNKEEAEKEGFIIIWLTDNKQRIPVKYIVDAGIGDIRLRINKESLENNQNKPTCKIRH